MSPQVNRYKGHEAVQVSYCRITTSHWAASIKQSWQI